ncbi:Fic family protein [Candidatus Peregrinibacteria bacterium]|nr:Fic family protein [Candidatus Peregrinibacteria bacterium]
MKFISRKVIKGQPYFYLQFQGVSRLLGNRLPDDLEGQMLRFFLEWGKKRSAKLPQAVLKEFPYGNLAKMEEARGWYACVSGSELFINEFEDFRKLFSIHFTFNSNRSEGSKTTRPEVEAYAKVFPRKPKTRTETEIADSFEAIDFAFSKKMKWTPQGISKVHKILLKKLNPMIAGKWKQESNVAPGNQPTLPPKEVKRAINSLLADLKKDFKDKKYPSLIAIRFYTRFEHIHPFDDGNGRVGRILFNAILHKYGYLPIVFFNENHKNHCEALTQAIGGRPAKFKKHFLSQAEKTFKLFGIL